MRGLLLLSSLAAALLAGVIAAGPATAQASSCTTQTAQIMVSPTTVAPGGRVQVSGSGYTANEQVAFFDNGTRIGQVNASGTGAFSGVPYTLPATATSGQHTLVGSQASGKCASTTFTVSGTTNTTTTSTINCPAGYVQSGTQCVPTSSTGFCPAGYVQSGTQCVYTGTSGGSCPAGYVQSGAQCVASGGGVCPTGYYFDGTQCLAGAYPGTYTGQDGCPPGYVNIGYACQPGPYASAYPGGICPPTGPYPPGTACAAAQYATPVASTPVVESTPQAVSSGRVAFTGSRTVRTVAFGLALVIGGLLLLSARAVVSPFRR